MEIVDRRVPLSQIGKTVGPSPVQRFLGNIRRNGVIVPILLREATGDGGEIEYRIIDGNRRVAAARTAGLRDVPARIFSEISVDDAARLTLAGNNFRSENDITEFWAIKHLERSRVTRQRIATDAGMTIKSLDLRNRWSTLDRRIFVGYANGRISATVARKVSRLPQKDQKTLGDLFATSGRLQVDDVEAIYNPRPERPSSPVYENDIPIRTSQVSGTGEQSLGVPHSFQPVASSRASGVSLTRHNPALTSPTFGHEDSQPSDAHYMPHHVNDPEVQGSRLERYNPDDVDQPPLIENEEGHHGYQAPKRNERDELSVTMVTIPVTTQELQQRHRPANAGLDEEVQRAIDLLARLGFLRGLGLDDVVGALAIAYRHMEFATKVTKETTRGRDYQS